MRPCLPVLILLALTACERAEKVEAPTRVEAERLDETETMLNELAASENRSEDRSSGQPKHRGDLEEIE